MSSRRFFVPIAGAASLVMVLAVILLFGARNMSSTPVLAAPSGCDSKAAINAALQGRGFSASEYTIGSVEWNATEANTRGQGAFTTQTPRSAQELVSNLTNGSPEAKAALHAVKAQSGSPKHRLTNPSFWTPVQFNTAFQLPGNTGYSSGNVVDAGTRQSAAGDIIWFFVDTSNCQSDAAAPIGVVRAGCGNPQTQLPSPVPGTNPTPAPNPLAKGPAVYTPCVDDKGVSCAGIPGSGGSPGNGGAVNHGDDGYSSSDPPPPTVVTTVPPPTSVVTIPPTTSPPTTELPPPPA